LGRQRRAHNGASAVYAKGIGDVAVRCDIHGRASCLIRPARICHRMRATASPAWATGNRVSNGPIGRLIPHAATARHGGRQASGAGSVSP
jgi:hypothetical protein